MIAASTLFYYSSYAVYQCLCHATNQSDPHQQEKKSANSMPENLNSIWNFHLLDAEAQGEPRMLK